MNFQELSLQVLRPLALGYGLSMIAGLAFSQTTSPAPTQGHPAGQNQKPSAGAAVQASDAKSAQKVQQGLAVGKTFAEATLAAKSGSKVAGTVIFNKTKKGIKVTATITGGTPGKHGIHIHEKGDCSAEDAASAGGHFNPTTGEHAGPEQQGRHVGDLGNVTVKQDGTGLLSTDIADIKGFTDWSGIIGKSVVVHEKADDLKTQPSGDSGKRLACGVIQAVTAP